MKVSDNTDSIVTTRKRKKHKRFRKGRRAKALEKKIHYEYMRHKQQNRRFRRRIDKEVSIYECKLAQKYGKGKTVVMGSIKASPTIAKTRQLEPFPLLKGRRHCTILIMHICILYSQATTYIVWTVVDSLYMKLSPKILPKYRKKRNYNKNIATIKKSYH